MSKFISIAKYDNIYEANLSASFLNDNKVETHLVNDRVISMMPGLAGSKISIELQVPEEQAKIASQLLQDMAFTKEALEKFMFSDEDDENWDDEEDDDEDWDEEDDDWDDDDDDGEDDEEIDDDVAQLFIKHYDTPEGILKNTQAILEGHFQLTSGRHSNQYVEKIRFVQNVIACKQLCSELASKIINLNFNAVVAPAYGGIALAYDIADLTGSDFLFCQRKDGEMILRSGFDLTYIKRVIVVEDVITTGSSVKEVIKCFTDKGIKVVGVAAIVDRSGGQADFGVPFISLVQLDIPTWEPDECPLCQKGIPLLKPGSSDKMP